jgi:hypothetical protein
MLYRDVTYLKVMIGSHILSSLSQLLPELKQVLFWGETTTFFANHASLLLVLVLAFDLLANPDVLHFQIANLTA